MKKFIAACFAAFMLLSAVGCGNEDKPELPENIISYENKENSDLIPNGAVEEHGIVIETDLDEDIPSEDELGEYQEIFMGGDILEDGSTAGWVLAISLKDITVNTYNKITKYVLDGDAKSCVDYIKPGDAVLLSYTEDEDGTKTAYDIGRVRIEDEALTKDEIEAMYAETMGQEAE